MNSKLNVLNESEGRTPWYKDGLRFACTECGKCCTGQPGYVWLTMEEIEKIADHLNLPVKQFMRTAIRQKEGRYSLVEKRSQGYDCIFLKDNKCQIYPVRPKQCRTYPWWASNLNSPESWKRAGKECEGIHPDAPIVPIEEIERNLQA